MSMLSAQIDELRVMAQLEKNLERPAIARILDDAADTILELRDDLQRANDALRDAEHDESVAWDRVRKVERENARLRELTRDYLIFYSQPGCTYCFCHDECRESEEPCMAFERLVDRTNELGIEVPR